MANSILKLQATVNQLYHAARKYVSIIFIIIIFIGERYDIEWLRIVSIFGLLLINNELLFNIGNQIQDLRKQKSYTKFSDAGKDILDIIDKENNIPNKGIRIKYLGMTLTNVFDTFEMVLEHLRKEKIPNVNFEVAMLDPNFLNALPSVRADWTPTRAQDNFDRFLRLKKKYEREISNLHWNFEIKKYNHMPCLHGMLINDHHLFLGVARW
jgi:hypothetical protein